MKKGFKIIATALASIGVLTFAGCNTQLEGKNISEVLAQGIVLENLGIDVNDVESLFIVKDSNEGSDYYKIEVVIDGVTYRYIVEAVDGTIVSVKINDQPVDPDVDKRPQRPTEDCEEYIGIESAIQIALTDAGATQESVEGRIRHKLDFDDGKYLYEIEFVYEGSEYEYEIEAISGEIYKKEVDDFNKHCTPPQGVEFITVEDAEAVVLLDLGLEQAEFLRVELEREHGAHVYEVEVLVDGESIEYEINAVTGAIIHRECEGHHGECPPPHEGGHHGPHGGEDRPQGETSITPEQAREIALAHAGLTQDQITEDKVELDIMRGIYVYEVEFETIEGSEEYEYIIDAQTGRIIEVEKEHEHRR